MLNFYQCFVHKAAALMHLLQAALKGKAPMHLVDWLLERQCIHRFLPATPTHNKSIAITSDASDYVVSLATCYAPVNVKYSTFGCELLALYLAIRHFCLLLEG